MIDFSLYKDGKKAALTMSYDDGAIADRRLAALFDEYGIRGTFHLNSGSLNRETTVTTDEIPTLYKNHEVSAHTVNHIWPDRVPDDTLLRQGIEDRRALERACGYPVRGMSYPYGVYSEHIKNILRAAGMSYSRTVHSTKAFTVPSDFMEWNPTCHHNDCLECADVFDSKMLQPWFSGVFYVWGHSYEFERNNGWELIEKFCKRVAHLDNVWYATNIEIFDYVTALRNLRVSVDEDMVFNPSATDIWLKKDGEPVKIPGGATVKF